MKRMVGTWGRPESNRRPTGHYSSKPTSSVSQFSIVTSGALSGEQRSHCRPTRLGYDPTCEHEMHSNFKLFLIKVYLI